MPTVDSDKNGGKQVGSWEVDRRYASRLILGRIRAETRADWLTGRNNQCWCCTAGRFGGCLKGRHLPRRSPRPSTHDVLPCRSKLLHTGQTFQHTLIDAAARVMGFSPQPPLQLTGERPPVRRMSFRARQCPNGQQMCTVQTIALDPGRMQTIAMTPTRVFASLRPSGCALGTSCTHIGRTLDAHGIRSVHLRADVSAEISTPAAAERDGEGRACFLDGDVSMPILFAHAHGATTPPPTPCQSSCQSPMHMVAVLSGYRPWATSHSLPLCQSSSPCCAVVPCGGPLLPDVQFNVNRGSSSALHHQRFLSVGAEEDPLEYAYRQIPRPP